ncbi:histidine phosphatase family protein [Flavobacterium sp. MAH-1]|uniref:Histidine phosphatase family protein n=1 Tax=Flavobacterium agri TaxID=2743471 RepID=A0A7Y8XZD9_9FLAO|nr:histidine phosphatase family protein [Flavobacterium agri]NUY79709.1 histidine phosphatase family protein [Flavobacterium agri]NYA69734.1 histidine phosphatase family protein [Flavobacterium agri]
MKNLIVVRHAKSSWDAPLRDIDRPLQQRGIKDAHLVSSSLSDSLPKTFVIISSPAKRASETAVIFAQNISYPVESIQYNEDLYTFDERQLEKEIRDIDNDYDNVILFGHNEAITNFVNKFGDIFIDNVTTSGVVSLTFDSDDWSGIDKGKTRKVLFPRDLKNEFRPI